VSDRSAGSGRSAAGPAPAGPTPAGPAAAGPARWFVLIAFGLLVAGTQLVWLSFAPITTQAHRALGVSEAAVGDLAGIFPLMYVLLALPTGRWMDRRFSAALATGAVLTAGGAVLRAAHPTDYGWVLAGQVLLAVGQPLVLNATTKIAARYFPPGERTTAISVGTAAQFVGILAAAMTGELFERAGGLPLLLTVHAAVGVAAAVAVLVALAVPPAFVAEATGTAATGSLRWLRHDPLMWRLAGLLFIGVGVFNAVATWLDTVLGDFGLTGVSGNLIAVMTICGIAGAAVVPSVAARLDRRRPVLLAAIVMTVLAFLGIATVHNLVFIGVVLALEGFFLLACLPVALDWSELESGPARASTATGFLLLAGNLGGAVLVLVLQALIGNPYLALVALAVTALPGVALVAGLPRHARSHLDDAAPQPVEASAPREAGP
jgi:predicted MFS family arabinose efflux permease